MLRHLLFHSFLGLMFAHCFLEYCYSGFLSLYYTYYGIWVIFVSCQIFRGAFLSYSDFLIGPNCVYFYAWYLSIASWSICLILVFLSADNIQFHIPITSMGLLPLWNKIKNTISIISFGNKVQVSLQKWYLQPFLNYCCLYTATINCHLLMQYFIISSSWFKIRNNKVLIYILIWPK